LSDKEKEATGDGDSETIDFKIRVDACPFFTGHLSGFGYLFFYTLLL
jgi:hypothetical protein